MSVTRKGTRMLILALIVAAFAFVYVGNAQSVSAATGEKEKVVPYTVEFTYGGKQHVMDGDTTANLSDVLKDINLTGEISDVKGSNDALFSFAKKHGVWYVTAHKAFDTKEWMKVTIDGIIYDIVVTDATYYGALKVNINANGGSFSGTTPLYSVKTATSKTTSVTASVTLPAKSSFSRSGYEFLGFGTASGVLIPSYNAGGTFSAAIRCTQSSSNAAQAGPAITRTLYAVWGMQLPASGTYRNVDWSIDANGVLTIGKSGETQTFSYKADEIASSWPWYKARGQITAINFAGPVVGNGSHKSMFYECQNPSFNTINNLSVHFNTSNVTDMSHMFYDCNGLTSLDVSGFNTSNVTDMSYMFYRCNRLTSLAVSGFDTSSVRNMCSMFADCSALTSLDLSSFDTSSVTNMISMFSLCYNLETICVSQGWNVDGVTISDNMFKECNDLVGGQGTIFNTSYRDKTYAKIDGGTSDPGYLTYKTMLKSDTSTITGIEFDRITVNNGEATFVKSLKSGQWFGIFGLGKEARYTVTEAGKENYEPSYKVSEGADGVQKPKDRNDEGQSLSNE